MSEFTDCTHPDLPGQVASISTPAVPVWQKLGWEPISESRTPAEALAAEVEAETAAAQVAEETPTLTIPQVLEEVGDDPGKAQAALDAELAQDKPRSTLVDRLKTLAAPSGDGDADAGQTGDSEGK